jgi:molybdate transport system ATP-binding protein
LSAIDPDLHVRLSHRVHPGLAIEVEFRLANECGVLFGPSGSGKSTILRLIAGLIRPRAGLVKLGDSILSDTEKKVHQPLRSRQIGLIFQDDLLFPHLDVDHNVRFGLVRWPYAEADARLAEVAALCGIEHLLARDPSTLSGGERQRVGLARALAPRPRLLLCDEPVSALDLEARHALIERIKRIQRLESIPVLYVTHSPDEAIALGSRLFLLENGRIVAEGAPLELLSTSGPRESFRLRNVFEAKVEGHEPDRLSTVLRIADGPSLVVAKLDDPVGTNLSVEVGADDIVLARGEPGIVSARNLLTGNVERVVHHGLEAEVFVRTGGVCWAVGVISTAVDSLGLIEGEEVRMIIKARSCRVLRSGG